MCVCVCTHVCILFDLFPVACPLARPPSTPPVVNRTSAARRIHVVLRLVAPWSPLRVLSGTVFNYRHLYSRRSTGSCCSVPQLEYAFVKDSVKIVPPLGKGCSSCIHPHSVPQNRSACMDFDPQLALVSI